MKTSFRINKTILIIFLVFVLNNFILSQTNEIEKKIKQKYIALISTELDLTEAESIKFWPVFNIYFKEKMAIQKEIRILQLSKKKLNDMTDEEVENYILKTIELKEKQIQLSKKYYVKFKEVIPVKKVAKFFHIEKLLRKKHAEHNDD